MAAATAQHCERKFHLTGLVQRWNRKTIATYVSLLRHGKEKKREVESVRVIFYHRKAIPLPQKVVRKTKGMSKLAHVLSHMTLPQGTQIHTYRCLAYFPSKKELLISFLIFNQLMVCMCACMHAYVHVCLCLCVCVHCDSEHVAEARRRLATDRSPSTL